MGRSSRIDKTGTVVGMTPDHEDPIDKFSQYTGHYRALNVKGLTDATDPFSKLPRRYSLED